LKCKRGHLERSDGFFAKKRGQGRYVLTAGYASRSTLIIEELPEGDKGPAGRKKKSNGRKKTVGRISNALLHDNLNGGIAFDLKARWEIRMNEAPSVKKN
jgi:hypothetical protein